MTKQFPMPIPFGWYCIGYTDELANGEVKNIHYFDRDMVLFRTESGELGLTDPYCPHLGAHLGHGGEVVGESIRCPFHHWSYDNSGFVTDVPYAKQIPPKAMGKACLKTYPIVEKNQVIWAWYHPENVVPFFDVIENPELNDPSWTPLERYFWTYNSTPQEIAENGVDVAHFKYIHQTDAVPDGETNYKGVIRHSVAEGPNTMLDGDGKEIQFHARNDNFQNGAGQKWSRFQGLVDVMLLPLVTPINSQQVEMRFAYSHKQYPQDSFEHRTAKEFIATVNNKQRGLEADIRIWHNKIHLREPLLCDGDGPVMRFRKYFAQFYVGGPYEGETSRPYLVKTVTA
jgi:3-ketosteroid 9alpha-monooxygenase subunit A